MELLGLIHYTNEIWNQWRKNRINALGAPFCKAFSIRHGILDRILTIPGTDGFTLYERPSYGLNVMTPDKQISLWLEIFWLQRAATIKSGNRSYHRPPSFI